MFLHASFASSSAWAESITEAVHSDTQQQSVIHEQGLQERWFFFKLPIDETLKFLTHTVNILIPPPIDLGNYSGNHWFRKPVEETRALILNCINTAFDHKNKRETCWIIGWFRFRAYLCFFITMCLTDVMDKAVKSKLKPSEQSICSPISTLCCSVRDDTWLLVCIL